MSKINKMPDFMAMASQLTKDLQSDAEKKGMEFIHNNFHQEGFTDSSFTAWDARKETLDFFLLRVTNYLFNSVSVQDSSRDRITFTADAPYAAAHNEGITTTAVAKVNEYLNRNFMGTGKQVKISAHTRNMNIKIPKRQFMGDSETFRKDWNDHVINEIITRFKRL